MATAVFCGDTVSASLECGLHCDAGTLMVFYGFIAGRGVLSAARVDYYRAFCWLWNVKCLDPPHCELRGSLGCSRKTGLKRW